MSFPRYVFHNGDFWATVELWSEWPLGRTEPRLGSFTLSGSMIRWLKAIDEHDGQGPPDVVPAQRLWPAHYNEQNSAWTQMLLGMHRLFSSCGLCDEINIQSQRGQNQDHKNDFSIHHAVLRPWLIRYSCECKLRREYEIQHVKVNAAPVMATRCSSILKWMGH